MGACCTVAHLKEEDIVKVQKTVRRHLAVKERDQLRIDYLVQLAGKLSARASLLTGVP